MTGQELGFLLLGSHLGDPERKPLSPAQLSRLWQKAQLCTSVSTEGEVDESFLTSLGYSTHDSRYILSLLAQEEAAAAYFSSAMQQGFSCVTRRAPSYPAALSQTLGSKAPAVLWLWGNTSLLRTPCISLVGSRNAAKPNLAFARAVGEAAARHGFTLVSGGARGVDQAGQDACLRAGGNVICVLPDSFHRHCPPGERLLYLCEDSFDLPFSARRALSRNHIIHILGSSVFVAQCGTRGGTWDGTSTNLRSGWRPVYLYWDGSAAADTLLSMGAEVATPQILSALCTHPAPQITLF